MTIDVQMGILEGIVVPTLLYGSESWVLEPKRENDGRCV